MLVSAPAIAGTSNRDFTETDSRTQSKNGFRSFHIHGSLFDGPVDSVSCTLTQPSNVICSAAVVAKGVEPSMDRRDFCNLLNIRLERATRGDRSMEHELR